MIAPSSSHSFDSSIRGGGENRSSELELVESTTSASSSTAFHAPPSSFRNSSKAARSSLSQKKEDDGWTINKLRYKDLGIYGRQDEVHLLEDCLDRMCQQSTSEFVLVGGHSGTGKSTLAMTVQKNVKRQQRNGIFARGKFDFEFRHHHQPYSGIIQVCLEILNSLQQQQLKKTTNSKSSQTGIHKEVRDAFRNSSVVVDVIPGMEEFLGGRPREEVMKKKKKKRSNRSSLLSSEESKWNNDTDDDINKNDGDDDDLNANKNRWQYAIREFFRIIVLYCFPLVIVLDDLQWADSGSLEVIEMLMAASTSQQDIPMMILGCYRANEVHKAHLLWTTIREIKAMSRSSTLSSTSSITTTTKQQQPQTQQQSLYVTEISLGNLNVNAINSILMDLLGIDDISGGGGGGGGGSTKNDESSSSLTLPLAELCHRRTGGNAFFCIAFVAMLTEKELLTYNLGLMKWTWDDAIIEERTMATINVVDLIESKMRNQVPEDVSKLLVLAACLGTHFEEYLISMVWEELSIRTKTTTKEGGGGHHQSVIFTPTRRQSRELLLDATDQLFLEQLKKDDNNSSSSSSSSTTSISYRWVHDKIQEAAISLVRPDELLRQLKVEAGEVLMNKLSESQLEDHIFIVCNLLNAGPTPTEPSRRIQMTRLNLQAAQKAIKLAAFESASTFTERGIDLLSSSSTTTTTTKTPERASRGARPALLNCWEQHRELSLDLYSTAVEVENTIGNVERVQRYSRIVLEQKNCSLSDKFRVNLALVDCIKDRQSPLAARDFCFDILKQMGCRFPSKSFLVMLSIGKGMVWARNHANSVGTLMDSMMTVNHHQAASAVGYQIVQEMKLLDKAAVLCFMTRSKEKIPLIALRMLELTNTHGLCELSPIGFVSVAVLMIVGLSDFRAGAQYADAGIKLARKLNSRRIEARALFIANAIVYHWSRPFASLQKSLLSCYEIGLQTGDTETAVTAILNYCCCSFQTGKNLENIAEDLSLFTKQMQDLKKDVICLHAKCLYQTVLNLIGSGGGTGGRPENTTILSGEVLREEDVFERGGVGGDANDGPSSVSFLVHDLFKAMLYVFFGEYDAGAQAAMTRCDTMEDMHGMSISSTDPFYRALALCAMTKPKRRHKKEAKRLSRLVKKWVRKGNPNMSHLDALLDAEIAAGKKNNINSKIQKAKRLYQRSIVLAARAGITHEAALANERYGHFLLTRLNDKQEAAFQIEESIRRYTEWGAAKKVELMKKQYSFLLLEK